MSSPSSALRLLQPGSVPYRRRVVLTLGIGFLMEQLDSSAIIVAIPAMAAELGHDPSRMALVVTSYMVTLAVLIPASGWIADRFGARRVFLCAICGFLVGSLCSAASQTLGQLILSRMLQSTGGALMAPVGRLMLLRSVSRADIVRALALMSTMVMIGPLVGPLLGGLAVSFGSWRWVFLLNLPIGAFLLVAAWRVLPPQAPLPAPRLDLRGFLLCALALLGLQLAAESLAGAALPHAVAWLCLALAMVAGALYPWHAAQTRHPVLRTGLLRQRAFRIGTLAGGTARLGLSGVTFLLPLQLQTRLGYAPHEAGTLVFVMAIGAIGSKIVTGPLIRHLGFRRFLIGTSALASILVASLFLLTPDTPVAILVGLLGLIGAVRSLHFNGSNALSYAELPKRRQTAGVTLGSVLQQLTMALGVTVSAGLIAFLGEGTDYSPGFVALAAFPVLACIGFLGLAEGDGATATGRRRVEK